MNSALVSAQSKTQIGIRAGVNYVNNVLLPNDSDLPQANAYRIGYHIGIHTKIQLSDKLYLSPELLFNNKGYKPNRDVNTFSSENIRTNLNYLTIPILVEYRPIQNLALQVGPEFGYLISAKTKFESETVDLFDIWKSLDIDPKRFEFGVCLGSEYLLTKELSIGIRYFHGLSSVIDYNIMLVNSQGNPISGEEPKSLNRTFQLSIAYIIW